MRIKTQKKGLKSKMKKMKKAKIAIVGTGERAQEYTKPIGEKYRDNTEVVGLCDYSQGRMEEHRRILGDPKIPMYHPKGFEKMLRAQSPDTVIVATPDNHHIQYILPALRAGMHVLCEKPVASTAEQCHRINDAANSSSGRLSVIHNLRFSTNREKVSKLLQDGAIGTLERASLNETLLASHGADYFRRWHSQRENSGSIWVHKGVHGLDLLRYWIGSTPTKILATASLEFFGDENGKDRGRCGTCEDNCGHYRDIQKSKALRGLFGPDIKDPAKYIRDQCVFGPTDVADTHQAKINWENGVESSYGLLLHSSIEGRVAVFEGSEGTLRLRETVKATQWKFYHPLTRKPHTPKRPVELTLTRKGEKPRVIDVDQVRGDHAHEDKGVMEFHFGGEALEHIPVASHIDAINSVLLGISADESARKEEQVSILQI
jgi:hypothetical protein